jgi:xanthine/uracil permease
MSNKTSTSIVKKAAAIGFWFSLVVIVIASFQNMPKKGFEGGLLEAIVAAIVGGVAVFIIAAVVITVIRSIKWLFSPKP